MIGAIKDRLLRSGDLWLLASVLGLLALGLTMVLSASAVMADKFYSDSALFFRRQLLYAFLGLGAMFFMAYIPRGFLFRNKYLWMGLALAALVLTLIGPLSREVNGAKRWLALGPIALQPMEFAKLALVIYLSWFFSEKQALVKNLSVGVAPPFAVTGLMCGLLLLQPDFGGAAFLVILLLFMCMAGGARLIYLFFSLMLACGAGWLLIIQSSYRSKRLLAFMDPFKDALDTGYQLVQSLYALGSGGMFGAGLGSGNQKLFFLPEAHTDFILAVLGEELGFLGVSLLFALMAVLLWRAFLISIRGLELRDRLAGFGMTLILALGAVLNAAVVLGVAPPKGVPMPFISYGGSSLIVSLMCCGFLLNLARDGQDGGGAR